MQIKYNISDSEIHDALKKIFGYSAFRLNQLETIKAILNQQDAIAIMPTGGGKSMCYQLPAFLMKGTTVVISPLISLMKDQVDAACAMGLRAAFINSTLSPLEVSETQSIVKEGELDLLYVSPERFAMESFIQFLKNAPINHFAVDEAHCISDWGHDFRPDYLSLSKIITEFSNLPISAYTATATEQVQNDIVTRLNLRNPFIVRASFDRENLFYRVKPKESVNQQIYDYISKHKDESGIIYRTTRKGVEETSQFLINKGIKCLPYHAGLSIDKRSDFQDKFNRDRIQVIVATIAFGMGIDKSNVRFVIHGDLPKNMESYYQETGRAGRDGEAAECTLFFGRGDIHKIKYFIDLMPSEDEQKKSNSKLQEMINFSSINACRRRQILGYFGENYGHESCNSCDVCTGSTEKHDATKEAQIIMSAIARTDQRFGITHIIDIVTGANTQRIRDLSHNTIKTYGAGKGKDKKIWRNIMNELIGQQCVVQSEDKYPVLKISKKGQDILKGSENFSIIDSMSTEKGQKKSNRGMPYNEKLFGLLRDIRKDIAEEKNIPPYIIFSDAVLHEMCRSFPVKKDEFLAISGIGEKRFSKYGESFKLTITKFIDDNPEISLIKPDIEAKEKTTKEKKEPTKNITLNLAVEGLSYKEIAEKRNLTVSTIANHIDQLIQEGHHIEINNHLSEEKADEIKKLFLSLKTQALSPVIDSSKNDITYEEARIVRAVLIQEEKL